MINYYAAIFPHPKEPPSKTFKRHLVLFPDFPELRAEGDTQEDAFIASMETLTGHVTNLVNENKELPVPTNRVGIQEKFQKTFPEYSGERLPKEFCYQVIPVPEKDLKPVRATMSFTHQTLVMIDQKADAAGLSRSAFLAAAAAAYQSPPPKVNAGFKVLMDHSNGSYVGVDALWLIGPWKKSYGPIEKAHTTSVAGQQGFDEKDKQFYSWSIWKFCLPNGRTLDELYDYLGRA